MPEAVAQQASAPSIMASFFSNASIVGLENLEYIYFFLVSLKHASASSAEL